MDDRAGPGDASYPVTYQAPLWNRIKPALIAAPLYILAIAGRAHLSSASPKWLWVGAVFGFLAVVAGALSVGFCKVTLYADRIEKRSFFGTKTMRRSEAGKLVKRQQGVSMLTYKYNSSGGITLPRGIGGDDDWNAWLDYKKNI